MKKIYFSDKKVHYKNVDELLQYFRDRGIIFGNEVKLGNGVELGYGVELGNGVKLGNWVKLGNEVELGDEVKLGDRVKISKHQIFTSNCLYKYTVAGYYDKNEQIIQMGCYTRKRKEWEEDFWNNPREFPNDNSDKSNERLLAFKIVCAWFDNMV